MAKLKYSATVLAGVVHMAAKAIFAYMFVPGIVMYFTVLYCTVLYLTVFYYTVLYCTFYLILVGCIVDSMEYTQFSTFPLCLLVVNNY